MSNNATLERTYGKAQDTPFNQNWCHAIAEKERSKRFMQQDFRREKENDGGIFYVYKNDEVDEERRAVIKKQKAKRGINSKGPKQIL